MRMTDLLEAGGVTYHDGSGHHHARAGWIQVDCPFCSPGSGRFRMGFNLSGKYWNCWVCGSYRLFEGLKAVLNETNREVRKLFKTEYLDDVPQKFEVRVSGKYSPPKGVGDLLPQHKRYLKSRGLNPNSVSKVWGVKGLGFNCKIRWRLYIPIIHQGREVSWTTRSISDSGGAKYITARPEQEEVFHKDLLFGEDFCRHAVIVNEGPLDAIAIGPGAVATMGVTYTRAQLLRIASYPVRVICFDNEPDAQRRARKLCDDLSVFDGATYNTFFTTGKDAARASKSEVRSLRAHFLES